VEGVVESACPYSVAQPTPIATIVRAKFRLKLPVIPNLYDLLPTKEKNTRLSGWLLDKIRKLADAASEVSTKEIIKLKRVTNRIGTTTVSERQEAHNSNFPSFVPASSSLQNVSNSSSDKIR